MQKSKCKLGKRALAVCAFCVLHFALLSQLSYAQGTNEALEAGFAALQKNDGDRAATAFRRALAAEPENPAALYGAGAAAYLQGRNPDAISFLKRALAIEPRLTAASALLGEIAYHQGDLSFAIKTYENALAVTPGNVELRQRLTTWRSEATVHDSLRAFKDDRFTILFDGPANRVLAERATTVLRSAFWRIGQALGSYPATAINVILYTDKQFHDITGAPEWAGAGFDGQIRMPVAGATQNLGEFDRILTHELTHAMLASIAARNVPAWLNEGLAMYFEGNNAAASEKRLATARAFVPLKNLEGGFTGLNSQQADLAYEMSAFATSALVTRIGPSNLGFLLQDLDRGHSIETAVERFGVTFADFEAQLAKRVGGRLR
jgi:tetratricopeptide (TPR) repeat protein